MTGRLADEVAFIPEAAAVCWLASDESRYVTAI
jgi:hypothetical protein